MIPKQTLETGIQKIDDKVLIEILEKQVLAIIEKKFPTELCKRLCDEHEARRVDELHSRIHGKTGDLGFANAVTSMLLKLIKARNALKKGGAEGLAGALEEIVKLLRETGIELDVSGVKNVYNLDENKLNEITKKLANRIDYMYNAIMKLGESDYDGIRPEIKAMLDLYHIVLDYFLFVDVICEASGYQHCTNMLTTLVNTRT